MGELLVVAVLACLALAVVHGDSDFLGAMARIAYATKCKRVAIMVDPRPEPVSQSGPMGSIVLSQGMLDATKSEGELVGVMARQIAFSWLGPFDLLAQQVFIHKDMLAVLMVVLCARPHTITQLVASIMIGSCFGTALSLEMVFAARRMINRPFGIIDSLGILVLRVKNKLGYWPISLLLLFSTGAHLSNLGIALLVYAVALIGSGWASREVEYHVDEVGLRIMVEAGINPREYQVFLGRLPETASQSILKRWLSDYLPSVRSRIQKIDETLTGWEQSYQEPVAQ